MTNKLIIDIDALEKLAREKQALEEATDNTWLLWGSDTVLALIERVRAAESYAESLNQLLEARDAQLSRVEEQVRELERRWEFRSPTPDAYEAACAALEKHRQRADAAEAAFMQNEQTKQELFAQKDKLLTANFNISKRLKEAEAELARLRAQEPVAFIDISKGGFDKGSKVIDYYSDEIQHLEAGAKLYAEPRPAVLPDKDAIREVFMRNGFTIKEGQADLKDYVYAAANALLALGCQPQRVIELPEAKYVQNYGYAFDMHNVFESLDAAGYPYKVPGGQVQNKGAGGEVEE